MLDISKYKIYFISIAIAALLAIVAKNNQKPFVPYQNRIDTALANAINESPDLALKYNEVKNKIMSIKEASLKGKDLGNTLIYIDNTYEIKVDVMRASDVRDRLEPIIAHEIYHVWEASKDLKKFLITTQLEKNFSWENKTTEKSAIQYENSFRQYLLTHNPEYKGMAKTREEQNARNN